jgi:hypothetical protein
MRRTVGFAQKTLPIDSGHAKNPPSRAQKAGRAYMCVSDLPATHHNHLPFSCALGCRAQRNITFDCAQARTGDIRQRSSLSSIRIMTVILGAQKPLPPRVVSSRRNQHKNRYLNRMDEVRHPASNLAQKPLPWAWRPPISARAQKTLPRPRYLHIKRCFAPIT